MWYNVDYKRLAILFLPTFLRKQKIVAFTQALVKSIDFVYKNWLQFREDNLYKISHTGQVCYLTKVLNDAFDNDRRRIYLASGRQAKREYIYIPFEQKPVFLLKRYLYKKEEYEDTGYDFLVFVPKNIQVKLWDQLKAVIEFYKLAGARYSLEPIRDNVPSPRKYLYLTSDKKPIYLGNRYLWQEIDYN